MARSRYVWRGRRKQKLRALQRILDMVANHSDPRFQDDYKIFVNRGVDGPFFKLLSRAATVQGLKEVIPEVPKVTA